MKGRQQILTAAFAVAASLTQHQHVVDAQNATESQEQTSTAAPTEEPECLSSLDLLETKMENQNPFMQTTYTLCPNTVFEIGFPDGDGVCCQNGMTSIYPRMNTLIQCGEDGSVTNNCIIRSGQYQVLAIEPNYFESIENFVMRGITFEDGGNAGLLLAQGGDMTFEDCIIKNHKHTGAVSLLYTPMGWDRRRVMEVTKDMSAKYRRAYLAKEYLAMMEGREHAGLFIPPADDESKLENNNERKLQDFERMRVNFINCIFEENEQGPKSSVTQSGVLAGDTEFNDIYIEGCTFRNNKFDTPPKGYAISARYGSTLEIHDSCFHDNILIGNGTVEVIGDVFFDISNNGGTGSDDLVCDFLAHIPEGANAPTCYEYDSTSCPSRNLNPIDSQMSSSAAPESSMHRMMMVVATLAMTLVVNMAILS